MLSSRVNEIKESPIRRIANLLSKAKQDKSIISFGAGAPSLPPPLELTNWLDEELRRKPHETSSYSATRGIPLLREEISKHLAKKKVKVDPENIVITIGATEGIYLALQAIVDKGDEVILFNPTYAGYPSAVKLAGGEIKWVPVHWKRNFQPDLETVEDSINEKTKALLLLSPDNPTGRVLSKDFVKGIVELADEKNFYIISDEIYKDIIYEGEHYFPRRYGKNVITVCSFSKEASIPGFREGYVYSSNEVIEGIQKIKQFVSLCSVTPAQIMLTKFYVHGAKEKYLKTKVIPTYRERRDFMVKMFRKYLPEADFNVPQGAFYMFPDMSYYLNKLKMNDEEFCDYLLKKKKVVVIPGHYFGDFGKNHVRFTFVSETLKRIEEGFKRIASLL